ncbi:MAG: invasion associated locus B family protein [Flavobacteriaceae bacterium]
MITGQARHKAGMALLALLAGLAFSTAASAQSGDKPAAPAKPAAEGNQAKEASQDNWVHICTKEPQGEKEICLVTQEVRTEQGQFVASTSVRTIKGEEKKTLLVAVPPGTLLVPGMRVQVDEGKQVPGQYTICLPNACYAELEIDDAFIKQMKGGNNLIISVINNQAKAVGIGLTLVGFTKAIDGAPIDSAELEKRRQLLQSTLKDRAEKLRAQQNTGGNAAPANGEKPKAQ